MFGLGPDGLTEGELAPFPDPAVVVALLLLVGAVLAVSFGLAGGALPRTEQRWSRRALLAGGSAAAMLGAAMLVLGGSVR